ncbi:MAG: winged helix-turn-helix transcriptional regulator [Paracoccaceae bacterium]
MTERGGYGQFCPISMAAEIVCARWTALLLRELLAGSTRFSDLRRGVPKMSPTLLSKRLRELEAAGVITAERRRDGNIDYRPTPMGEDLRPIVMALGTWGQKWVESKLSLRNLDPSLLMWDMRRSLNLEHLPRRRCTIQFLYPELRDTDQAWWLVIDAQDVDLCKIDPGFEIDLLVTANLRSMTGVWMGVASFAVETTARRISVDGDPHIARAMTKWLGPSRFAGGERRVA